MPGGGGRRSAIEGTVRETTMAIVDPRLVAARPWCAWLLPLIAVVAACANPIGAPRTPPAAGSAPPSVLATAAATAGPTPVIVPMRLNETLVLADGRQL